jgi:hypothetical protein
MNIDLIIAYMAFSLLITAVLAASTDSINSINSIKQ